MPAMPLAALRVSYVVPVHNEETGLRDCVTSIAQRLSHAAPGSEVALVENASTDGSPDLVRRLAAELTTPHVSVWALTSAKGYGNALRAGIAGTGGDLVVLTAADLPFGFTDLDGVLSLHPRPPLVIGSKHHHDSRVDIGGQRRVMSHAFRLVRAALLGIPLGDTQGSLLIDGGLARRLLPTLQSEDYLLSTEIVAAAVADGVLPAEVPVVYTNPRRDSKIRPVADSVHMLAGLVGLRRRFGSLRPAFAASRHRGAPHVTAAPVSSGQVSGWGAGRA